jgi:hypothetical protein
MAATGEAPEPVVHAIVGHSAGCRACAEDWRLARGIEHVTAGESAGLEDAARVVKHGVFHRSRAALAIAASVLLAVAGAVYVAQRANDPGDSGYRTPPTESIRSLLPEADVQPRDRCQLRWSAAPGGSRYDVIVTTERLDPVLESRDLETAELVVPSSELGLAPGGGDLLWRVEATLPDGSRMVSPTFRARCH